MREVRSTIDNRLAASADSLMAPAVTQICQNEPTSKATATATARQCGQVQSRRRRS